MISWVELLDIDLIFKGAYVHSRLRENFFGMGTHTTLSITFFVPELINRCDFFVN